MSDETTNADDKPTVDAEAQAVIEEAQLEEAMATEGTQAKPLKGFPPQYGLGSPRPGKAPLKAIKGTRMQIKQTIADGKFAAAQALDTTADAATGSVSTGLDPEQLAALSKEERATLTRERPADAKGTKAKKN